VAIVTGSGRGIGRATARLLALQGARVVVSDLDSSFAQETVEAVKATGGRAMPCTETSRYQTFQASS